MRAYPYEIWPRVHREDIALTGRCARRLPPLDPHAVAETLAPILGAHPVARLEPLQPCPAGALRDSLTDPLVAALIEPARGARIAVEIDPRLAACAIDRALGGSAGDTIGEPAGPLTDAERGVLAYVCARALAGSGWRLLSIVTSPAALLAAVGDAGSIAWPATVAIGPDAGVIRAWIPETALGTAPQPRPVSRATAGLPLTLTATVGHASLARADFASLRPGDVLIPDACTVRSTPETGGFTGEALLRVAGARRTTWRCTLDERGLTVKTIERTEEPPMSQGQKRTDPDPNPSVEVTTSINALAGDAPIELSLEIARFSVPLEDLGSLRAGEVVTTGRAIGSDVVLRAGDRVIATGELVDVDGEVGVRLLRLG